RLNADVLRAFKPAYREFTIPKRSGDWRVIAAPEPDLKKLQRTILYRLLSRLPCHAAATGFRRKHSTVMNALPHVGKAVVVRMDIKRFFEATLEDRVESYFQAIGWNREASQLITRLCTYQGGLPQ